MANTYKMTIAGLERELPICAVSDKLDIAALIACCGGGSNSIGFFSPFIDRKSPRLIAVEAGGTGPGVGQNASRMTGNASREGIMQGYKSRFLLDEDGQSLPTSSISAGLDYCGIGPQLAALGNAGRIEFTSALDKEALDAVVKENPQDEFYKKLAEDYKKYNL